MKIKRIVQRPFGARRKGGWIIQRQLLLDILKKGDAVELDKVIVGAKQLRSLINLLPTEECLLKANGRLEVQTIDRVMRTKNGVRKPAFVKPKHYHQELAIADGAWVKTIFTKVLVLRPRKYA